MATTKRITGNFQGPEAQEQAFAPLSNVKKKQVTPATEPTLNMPNQKARRLTGNPQDYTKNLAHGIAAPKGRPTLQPETQSDTSIRFSKHSGPEINFPLDGAQSQQLRNSNAVSPFLPVDPRVCVQPDFLPKPTHPGDQGFWQEFEQIIDFQIARRNDADPGDFVDLPKIFADFDIHQAAEAVRADFPTHWPTALTQQFLSEGAKIDPSIIPPRSQDDFVNGPVLLARMIGWAVSEVSPSAFACKWKEGRARPESVAWAVQSGQLAAPQAIKDKIASLNLQSPEDFTAYDEGCPRHPSWPAMHSAASCASLYLAVLLDLSPEQITEARRLDFAVAQFRSVAGVHYETDNRAGLALGQEVMAKRLPEILKEFGASEEAVKAKIEQVRHDWFAYEAKS
ncbi:MAG: hypothetical protein QGI45_10630 [Myxococcota bacterium]|jgi:hypothetical protein|nr:hypothetical protein [Myxococcota bacterium]